MGQFPKLCHMALSGWGRWGLPKVATNTAIGPLVRKQRQENLLEPRDGCRDE
jgi:hypothetical protein